MNPVEPVVSWNGLVNSFVNGEPNAYLLCHICRRVYSEPVVNVKCGHTFCRKCLTINCKSGNGNVECPIDGDTCSQGALVLNRAIHGQIDNLDVRCKFYNQGYGCKDIFKYGKILKHEEKCSYAITSVQNTICFPNKSLEKNIKHDSDDCNLVSYKHVNGHNFERNLVTVNSHEVDGIFQNNCEEPIEKQLKVVMASNQNIIAKVTELAERLQNVEATLSLLPKRETPGQLSIEKYVEQKISRKHSSITFRPPEAFWVMPFQFNCIGTMNFHKSTVTSILSSNQMIFSSDQEGFIKTWGLEVLEKGSLMTYRAGKKKINAMVIYNEWLFTAGDDLTIRCLSVSSLHEISSITDAHDKSILALICSAGNLFSSSFTVVKVWRCDTLEHLHTITGMHHWVRSLATNALNDTVYVGSHGMVGIWKASDPFHSCGKITDPIGSVHSLTITKQFIIAGTYNKNMHLYDVENLQRVHHFTGHVGIITGLVSPHTQKFLISCSSDTTILLWCLEKMLPIQIIQRHEAGVTCIAVVDNVLLTGSEDTEIKIFKQCKC